MTDLTKFDITFATLKVVYSDVDHQKVAMRLEDGTILMHDTLFTDLKGTYCVTSTLPSTKREMKCQWAGHESAKLIDAINAQGTVNLHYWNQADEADYELFQLIPAFEG
ncbi:hypothetical protein VPHK567_0068 [Vibrio phage K567]|nr:hypothetical protein MYOV011v1_p0136 [Vibrio phage 6E35.1a]